MCREGSLHSLISERGESDESVMGFIITELRFFPPHTRPEIAATGPISKGGGRRKGERGPMWKWEGKRRTQALGKAG